MDALPTTPNPFERIGVMCPGVIPPKSNTWEDWQKRIFSGYVGWDLHLQAMVDYNLMEQQGHATMSFQDYLETLRSLTEAEKQHGKIKT